LLVAQGSVTIALVGLELAVDSEIIQGPVTMIDFSILMTGPFFF